MFPHRCSELSVIDVCLHSLNRARRFDGSAHTKQPRLVPRRSSGCEKLKTEKILQSRSANPHIESASNLRNGELKTIQRNFQLQRCVVDGDAAGRKCSGPYFVAVFVAADFFAGLGDSLTLGLAAQVRKP